MIRRGGVSMVRLKFDVTAPCAESVRRMLKVYGPVAGEGFESTPGLRVQNEARGQTRQGHSNGRAEFLRSPGT